MKEYDHIIVGSGSAANLIDPLIQKNPKVKIAVIDKDEPGGICLTRGCIPSKLLLYPAEIVRMAEKGAALGVAADVKVDFAMVMKRMRTIIDADIDSIREGLSSSPNIDYYHAAAEFSAPYTLRVGGETIRAKQIFLCTGSRTVIPPVKNLEKVGYLTSDSVLRLTKLPRSIAIMGGGYIAAEYGHFFSSMGSTVAIVGRNPQFLPGYEPEVALVARRELEKHMRIVTNHEVLEVGEEGGTKTMRARDRATGETAVFRSEEIMVATGREPLTDVLHPERSGIKIDEKGWIAVDEYLQTSQPNIWALGDADGKYLFKHVANYESQVVYYNAVQQKRVKVDYHAVPHAVFTYPEIAGVGLSEREAVAQCGEDDVLIGFYQYENTAKGEAMDAKGYFVKAVVQRTGRRILGAQIVGPYASILIQEIINLMYTPGQGASTLTQAMHIHPSLSEVVERAFLSLMPVHDYHHMLGHLELEPSEEVHKHE